MKRLFTDPKHCVAIVLIAAAITFLVYEVFAAKATAPVGGAVASGSSPLSAPDPRDGTDAYRLLHTSWTKDPQPTGAPTGSRQPRESAGTAREIDKRVLQLQKQLDGIEIAVGRAKR